MFLNELKAGERAVVRSVGGEGALRQHFLDMGVIPGAEITLVKFAPMGDPIEFRIHEYELTLRVDDAKQIGIEKLPKWESDQHPVVKIPHEPTDHPGLGEGGRYHVREGEHPLPDDQLLTFALAGNQNCGKTTLFNQLTGSNQHVGNFPGVTVDQKSGSIRGHENTKITDLPGIYSMSPYTDEEIVSREFILREQPTGIINIVDATNIERNLYLTLQLIELGRLRVDLPHRQQTTRTVDTTLQHSALVIGSIVAIHIHNDLSAHLKGIALGLHRGVPLLHGTITIAAIINGLYQRRLGRRRSNRIGQCCRVGISCAGACQKCHGQSGGKGSGFRFS